MAAKTEEHARDPVRPPARTGAAEHLFGRLSALTQDLGFRYCAYGIRMPLPISNPVFALFNNYQGEIECYVGHRTSFNANEHDSINDLRSALNTRRRDAGDAHSTIADPGPELSAAARHSSGAVGLLLLNRSSAYGSTPFAGEENSKIAALADLMHTAMSRLLLSRYIPEIFAPMTSREKEVLRWTADGKTCSEIGQIINLSERTVKFHLVNAIKKLNATNKTQAAVKAAALGLFC